MASRPIDLDSTHTKLANTYAVHGTRRKVSQALGVDEKTISRWLKALADKGYKDPRPRRAPKKPRKPAGKPDSAPRVKKELAQ